MITTAMLTGRTTDHLVPLQGNHRLQLDAAQAFLTMQIAAKKAGFMLHAASSFRDFARQQCIWNGKFRGERPVLDKQSCPVDILQLTEGTLCETILHWSAMPGASRHHWGTEVDIYDPNLLPSGASLQLEPWEYEAGGYFSELTQWLTENMTEFDFYRPFTRTDAGVAYEPWHLSYRPLSDKAATAFTAEVMFRVLKEEDIAGKSWLLDNLPYVYQHYIQLPK